MPTPDFLLRFEISPQAKVLDLKGRVRCRGCGTKGRVVVSVKRGRQGGLSRAVPYGGAKRDRTRAARGQRVGVRVLRAIVRRPRPARQQPPRWLPKTRATGATRWLRTRQ